ncbi:sulfite exporter TauE/SafE family protein [bacterium]|nr:sulfite exporter TauE/SafE family protein [bacterium]
MENLTALFTGETSLLLLFGLSFLGGLVASVSPCSLAMLPIIIGYVGGYSKEKPVTTFFQTLSFVLGTAIIFSIIGILCAVTGKVFIAFAGGYFGIILAGIIMVMGLKLIGFLDFEMPVLIKELPTGKIQNNFLYPVLLGGTFALIGTPCSTPILAGIMAFASLSASIGQAILMLFLFSLGQGLILILAGVLTSRLKTWKNFYALSDMLMKFSGFLLVLSSAYIFYKIFLPLVG